MRRHHPRCRTPSVSLDKNVRGLPTPSSCLSVVGSMPAGSVASRYAKLELRGDCILVRFWAISRATCLLTSHTEGRLPKVGLCQRIGSHRSSVDPPVVRRIVNAPRQESASTPLSRPGLRPPKSTALTLPGCSGAAAWASTPPLRRCKVVYETLSSLTTHILQL